MYMLYIQRSTFECVVPIDIYNVSGSCVLPNIVLYIGDSPGARLDMWNSRYVRTPTPSNIRIRTNDSVIGRGCEHGIYTSPSSEFRTNCCVPVTR